jgi:hypothetical protein
LISMKEYNHRALYYNKIIEIYEIPKPSDSFSIDLEIL